MTGNSPNFPPCCFCFKPASTLKTGIGIVYECHYTEQFLWIDSTADNSSKIVENNNCCNNNNGTPQLQSKSIPTPPPSNIDPKARESIQDIVSALAEIARTTKAIPPTTWGSTSYDFSVSPSPTSSPTPIIINHINPQPIARPKTTISKSTFQKLTLPPNNSQQKIVCGFHMHSELWDMFRTNGRRLELERREKKRRNKELKGQEHHFKERDITAAKQETLLARWHHEIILRHRSLQLELRSLVVKNQCKPYHQTFERWTNWGEEVIGIKTSPTGGAPHCACGLPMKLSWLNRKCDSSIVFFCELRLADIKSGCSRVVNSGKWVQWQELDPVHSLIATTRSQLIETPTTYILSSDEEHSSYSGEDEDEDEDRKPNILIEAEEEPLLTEAGCRMSDHGENEMAEWDEHVVTSQVSSVKLRKLEFPSNFFDDESDEEIASRQNQRKEHSHSDEYGHENPWFEPFTIKQKVQYQNQSKSKEDDHWNIPSNEVNLEVEMSRKVRALAEKVHGVHNGLAPSQMIESEGIEECEKSLSVLLESCDRMKEYTLGSYKDGLNNPTLKCRICKEGTLLSVNTPCFHLVMCDQCIQEYRQCIICKSAIQSSQRVFW